MQVKIIPQPSRTFSDTENKPEWIILHCIGYDEAQALDILVGEDCYASAHYFVPHRHTDLDEVFPIYQLVPDLKQAYHAGSSYWRGIEKFNTCSIGIEFHLPNYAYAMSHPEQLNWYHFEKFTDSQMAAGFALIETLMQTYHIPATNILTHADIAAWREIDGQPQVVKTDPGAYFHYHALAKRGIGAWPAMIRTRQTLIDISIGNVQKLLQEYGYKLELTHQLDIPTLSCIRAFKMRYFPEAYDRDQINADITAELIIALENLIDAELKYPLQPFEKSIKSL